MKPASHGLLAGAVLAAVAGVGCASAPPPEAAPTETLTRDGLCERAKEHGLSLVVLSSPAELAKLAEATKRSIAVVRYDGCELEVLSACQGLGVYHDDPTPDALGPTTLATREAFAESGIGASPLFDELQHGAKLDVTITPRSARSASKPPAMAQGDCTGATHWVRAVRFGASHASLVPGGGGATRALASHDDGTTPYAVELEPMHGP